MEWFASFSRNLLITLLAIAIGIAIGVCAWFLLMQPRLTGNNVVSGLQEQVTVIRGREGVPIITANSPHDLYFALGYAHAQDRLWQMDMYRRIGAGRLSEVMGHKTLEIDRLMRVLGLYQKAQGDWDRLQVKNAVDAYTQGVNAFMAAHRKRLPPEFTLLRYTPEPWQPADTMVLARMMAMLLGVNFPTELERFRLAQKLSPEQIEDFYPSTDSARLLPPIPALTPALSPNGKTNSQNSSPLLLANILDDLDDLLFSLGIGQGASNAWAIHGSKTVSNDALLAADPHLELSIPNIWYLVKLHSPEISGTGVTIPGSPHLIFGNNGQISWGFTTSYIDTQDIFRLHLHPSDKSRYETNTDYRLFDTRFESIRVRGEKTVNMEVRDTLFGPVISDAPMIAKNLPDNTVLALRATALDPDMNTAEALQQINWSRSFDELATALRRFDAPAQNIVFADSHGNIGFKTLGRIPVRAASAGEGFVVQDASASDRPWLRYIPFEELPGDINPERGYIISANNALPQTSYFLSREYDADYRARRIATLLDTPRKWSANDMTVIQLDTASMMGGELHELLESRLDKTHLNGTEQKALVLLNTWNMDMKKLDPAPLIFMTWLHVLSERIYADELAGTGVTVRRFKPLFLKMVLTRKPQWCDDISTRDHVETCEELITQTFHAVIDDLTEHYGNEPNDWRWEDAHRVALEHPLYSKIPLLGRLTTIKTPNDGGPFSVNRADYNLGSDTPFRQIHGSGARMVIDMGRPEDSLFMLSSGESGNLFNRNYADLTARWARGDYFKIDENAGNYVDLGRGTLTLIPGAPLPPAAPSAAN